MLEENQGNTNLDSSTAAQVFLQVGQPLSDLADCVVEGVGDAFTHTKRTKDLPSAIGASIINAACKKIVKAFSQEEYFEELSRQQAFYRQVTADRMRGSDITYRGARRAMERDSERREWEEW
jgi:hypothetical protein